MRDGKHVRLIEDEPSIIEAVRFILSREGWRVATYSDAVAAVAAVRARPRRGDPRRDASHRVVYDILSELRIDPAIGLTLMVLTDRDREIALPIGATRCMTEPSADADLIAAVRDLAHLGGDRMTCAFDRRCAVAAAMLPVAGLVPFSIPVLWAEGPGGAGAHGGNGSLTLRGMGGSDRGHGRFLAPTGRARARPAIALSAPPA